MLISLDNSSSVPLYQQIVDQIKDRILIGALGPGDPLPSIRQLAAQLLTSVITVRRAYQDLESEGLIVTRPGLGTFVSNLKPEDVRGSRLEQIESMVIELVQTANRLGVSKEEILNLFNRAMDLEVSK